MSCDVFPSYPSLIIVKKDCIPAVIMSSDTKVRVPLTNPCEKTLSRLFESNYNEISEKLLHVNSDIDVGNRQYPIKKWINYSNQHDSSYHQHK